MPSVKDLAGRRFGKLTVVEFVELKKNRACWLCRCDCGNTRTVPSDKLTAHRANSCGCFHPLRPHKHSWQNGKRAPTYSSWQNMIARCTQPSHPAYAHYRKIGVTICDRWRSFENFLADMGERPSREHTLDRYPNMSGNYEPGNCRWATKAEQSNNRLDNPRFAYNGRFLTLKELATVTGKSYDTLRHRLIRANWPLDKALSEPIQQGRRTDRVAV